MLVSQPAQQVRSQNESVKSANSRKALGTLAPRQGGTQHPPPPDENAPPPNVQLRSSPKAFPPAKRRSITQLGWDDLDSCSPPTVGGDYLGHSRQMTRASAFATAFEKSTYFQDGTIAPCLTNKAASAKKPLKIVSNGFAYFYKPAQDDITEEAYDCSEMKKASNEKEFGGRSKSCNLVKHGVVQKAEMDIDVEVGYELSVDWPILPASEHAVKTINPVRQIVDALAVAPNPEKSFIKLHLGDPTITGELPPHPAFAKAISDAMASGLYNGYGPAVGFPKVREVLADHVDRPEAPVKAHDIILTSGCSHALQMAIEAMANHGQNILCPTPGFPLYDTLMTPHEITPRFYKLLPEKEWAIDVDDLESQIDGQTAAILVNNPSNPTGAVFKKENLEAVLRVAQRYRVPIIADEIYGDMVYDGAEFLPMSTLEPKVPIITCDGIAKRWLVPGWRLGWIIINDPTGALAEIREGLKQLATKIVGPCALIQGILPSLLSSDVPASFFDHSRSVMSRNAAVVLEGLTGAPGLKPVRPYGAMYVMIQLDLAGFGGAFDSDLAFTQALIQEESVFCLPGSAFKHPGAIRLVLTYSAPVMADACRRLTEFAKRHYSEKLAAEANEAMLANNTDIANGVIGIRSGFVHQQQQQKTA